MIIDKGPRNSPARTRKTLSRRACNGESGGARRQDKASREPAGAQETGPAQNKMLTKVARKRASVFSTDNLADAASSKGGAKKAAGSAPEGAGPPTERPPAPPQATAPCGAPPARPGAYKDPTLAETFSMHNKKKSRARSRRPARPARARGAATFFHRGTRSQKLIVNINSRIYAYAKLLATVAALPIVGLVVRVRGLARLL